MGADGLFWVPLTIRLLASCLCLLLLGLVGLDAVKEVLAALGVLHMLHAHGHPLGKDLTSHTLVHDDADSVFGDVEHTP